MKRTALTIYLAFSAGLIAGENPAADKNAMRTSLREYFADEKTAALIGLGGAAVAGATGAYLATRDDLSRGIGYTLIGVGAIGVVVGGAVYLRTDGQMARLENQLESSPAEYKKLEGARMERVNFQFKILKIAEVSLFTGGVTTAIVGVAQKADLTTGIGIGLALDAVLLFLFDYFAEARAHVYAQRIAGFSAAAKNSELIQGLSFSYRF